jgi:hypothetical protein
VQKSIRPHRIKINPKSQAKRLEHIGHGELVLLALRRFVGVRGKRGDVNEPSDSVIGSCGGDDASAVRVADEDGWAADPP